MLGLVWKRRHSFPWRVRWAPFEVIVVLRDVFVVVLEDGGGGANGGEREGSGGEVGELD